MPPAKLVNTKIASLESSRGMAYAALDFRIRPTAWVDHVVQLQEEAFDEWHAVLAVAHHCYFGGIFSTVDLFCRELAHVSARPVTQRRDQGADSHSALQTLDLLTAPRAAASLAGTGRELNRTTFDYAPQVIVGDGKVFFGSSADHKVYALNRKTGLTAWEYFTEGPVRFAPAYEDGHLFVASDDGWLHCLAADSGKLLWRFRGGPSGEKMIGNGRVISRWPLRSGVAVRDGIVYLSAGMWPSEGVFVYALRAADGQVVWKNDTCGTQYIQQPHPPSGAVTGVSPQGSLSLSQQRLFIPTGRSTPAAFDRQTGRLLYYRSRPDAWGDRWGGSWTMLADDLVFNWRAHVGGDIDIETGEYQPDANDGMVAFDAETGEIRRDFPGKLLAIVRDDILYAAGSGHVSAYGFSAWKEGTSPDDCLRWETQTGRAYSLILAGNTLIVGGEGTVAAIDSTSGQSLWDAELNGQARCLAVADGCLLASTTSGEISCFGIATDEEPLVHVQQEQRDDARAEQLDAATAERVRQILEQSKKTEGYCLVLGAGDSALLAELANRSKLTIHCVEPDAERVDTIRRQLDQRGLYGPRVVVHQGSLLDVSCPEYFAELVIVSPSILAKPNAWPAEIAYRSLHPSGGVMCCAANGDGLRDAFRTWLDAGQVARSEIVVASDSVRVTRSPLSGADDWTHQYANAQRSGSSQDQRVRLPLRLLWFGEPGPEQMVARHWKGPAPLCVDGRMYVIGQHAIIAVDAYNGRELWRRKIDGAGRFPVNSKGSNVVADPDSVFVAVGKECLQLAGRTGQTVRTYAIPPSALPDGNQNARWSYLAVNATCLLGSAGNDREGSTVFLLDREGQLKWSYKAAGIVGNNALAMDDRFVYLIDQSPPQVIEQSRRRGQTIPIIWKLIALDAESGDVAWETETGISGRSELWLSGGIVLSTGGGRMSAYDAATGECLYARASEMQKFPVIVGDTIYGEPVAYDLRSGERRTRQNPFTGKETPWTFSRTYGCGSVSGCPNLLMFRSGNLGLYDLTGDGGVQDIGGVRAGCHVNAIAAAGLLLMPPGDASCTCSYAFQTTIALVPTQKQENWGLFYKQLPNTPVRQVALNLGAPGDRRDNNGTLWLATPRPANDHRRQDIAVPFRLEQDRQLETYRKNADLTAVEDTDRPWLYTSGVRGPIRAELDLEIFDRGVTAWPASADEQEGDRFKAISAPDGDASVVLRYDDENLYVRYQRSADVDSRGQTVAWKQVTAGEDAEVWQDDCVNVMLSNTPAVTGEASQRCLHLGVSASGARYDGLWQYVTPALPLCDLPQLAVTVDGDTTDWANKGLVVRSLPAQGGKLLAAKDFDPCLRMGWNENGLLVLAEIQDDVLYASPDDQSITEGDSLELFVTPRRGTPHHYAVVIGPSADGPPRVSFLDRRSDGAEVPLNAEIAGKVTDNGYRVEILLPWENLSLLPTVGLPIGLQVFVNDSDRADDRSRMEALWHPAGNPTQDALAYQEFRLAQAPSEPIVFRRGEKPDRSGLYNAAAPLPFPVVLPAMGAQAEDKAYSGSWTAAVETRSDQLSIEMAIPWQTIAEAGLDRSGLMVSFDHPAVLTKPPVLAQGFERLIVVPAAATEPRQLDVRLHFAELDEAEPGQRIFDIKLQGKLVREGFDIAKTANRKARALALEFRGVKATRALSCGVDSPIGSARHAADALCHRVCRYRGPRIRHLVRRTVAMTATQRVASPIAA